MILVKAVLECRTRPAFIERDKVPIIFIFVTIEFAHASDFGGTLCHKGERIVS